MSPSYCDGTYGTQVARRPEMALTPQQAAGLAAVQGQKRVTCWPYYSTVKFVAIADGDPAAAPVLYDYGLGAEVRAFSYGVNDAKLAAGYTAADGVATIADTNLTARNQTTGGQNVLIHGIALQIVPAAMHLNDGDVLPHRIRLADAHFLAALQESVSVELVLNGDENTFRLGTLGMIPGAGGLAGGAFDAIGSNPFAGDQQSLPFPTNGWPTRSNFFRVPEGLVWRNQSNADSMLNVRFRNTRRIALPSGGTPENNIQNVPFANAIGVQSTGVELIFPTELAVEYKVFLVASVWGPRTRSA